MIRERISAIVDGELGPQEREDTLRRISRDPDLGEIWHRYHLFGAAFRNEPVYYRSGLAEKIVERIDSEPLVSLAYRRYRSARWLVPVALAASIAGIAVSGLSLFGTGEGSRDIASRTKVETPQRMNKWETSDPGQEDALNAFLVEHGEFTQTSGMNGLTAYAKFVSYDSRD